MISSNIVKDYLSAAIRDLDKETKDLNAYIAKDEEILKLMRENIAKTKVRLINIASERLEIQRAAELIGVDLVE